MGIPDLRKKNCPQPLKSYVMHKLDFAIVYEEFDSSISGKLHNLSYNEGSEVTNFK